MEEKEEKKKYLLRKLSFRPSVDELKTRKVIISNSFLFALQFLSSYFPVLFLLLSSSFRLTFQFFSSCFPVPFILLSSSFPLAFPLAFPFLSCPKKLENTFLFKPNFFLFFFLPVYFFYYLLIKTQNCFSFTSNIFISFRIPPVPFFFIYLSIYLPTYQPTYLPTYLPIYQNQTCTFLLSPIPLFPFLFLSIYLSIGIYISCNYVSYFYN